MKFIRDPAERTTAITDIILAFVTFGGIFFLRCLRLNSGELWKINIWSAAIGLIGLAAALGAVAHGLVLSRIFHRPIWLMATGIFFSIIAAGIQANKSIFLTFIWQFDHNGIYHMVQVAGLMLLLMGLRWSVLY